MIIFFNYRYCRIAIVIAFLCLTACISTPRSITVLKLLEPKLFVFSGATQNRLTLVQVVKIMRPNYTSEHMVLLEIAHDQIRLRGLSPFGQTIFQISYDGDVLFNNSPQFTDQQAHHIMASLMFSLWPEAVLRSAYVNLEIETQSQNSRSSLPVHNRSLKYDGILVLEVTYDEDVLWSENIRIRDYMNNIELSIKTLEVISDRSLSQSF